MPVSHAKENRLSSDRQPDFVFISPVRVLCCFTNLLFKTVLKVAGHLDVKVVQMLDFSSLNG